MGLLRRLTRGGLIWLAACLGGGRLCWGAATLEIRTDPRIELIGIVQQLAGSNPFERSPVLEKALADFSPWKSHPAVRRLAAMAATGFSGNVPASYAVYLSTPPALREAVAAPEFFARAAGGPEKLEAFRGELEDFVRVSGFDKWYEGRRPDNEALVASFREALSGADVETPLVRYLGLRSWDHWFVVVSAFFPAGATSSWVLERPEGLPDIYVIDGPSWKEGRPSFGPDYRVAGDIWSEPLYSTTYLMYEACRPAVSLRPDICDGIRQEGLDPENCAQELWVRGISERLMQPIFGSAPRQDSRKRRPKPKLLPQVLAALELQEGRPGGRPFLVDSAAELLAPLQKDGRAPRCVFIDPDRFSQALYARRLRSYLDMRLAAKPDPELYKARADLARYQHRLRPALADLKTALELAPRDWPARPQAEKEAGELESGLR